MKSPKQIELQEQEEELFHRYAAARQADELVAKYTALQALWANASDQLDEHLKINQPKPT